MQESIRVHSIICFTVSFWNTALFYPSFKAPIKRIIKALKTTFYTYDFSTIYVLENGNFIYLFIFFFQIVVLASCSLHVEICSFSPRVLFQVPFNTFRIKSVLKASRIFSLLGRTPGKSGRATSYRTPRLVTVPWQKVSARTSVKKRDVKKWNKDLNGV